MPLLFLLSLLATTPDSFEFREIARVRGFARDRYVCGDADHDGRQEIYMMLFKEGEWTNYILEYTGGSQFDTFPLGYIQATVWDIGDADQDGKTDLLAETEISLFSVLESADSMSLPSVIVWRVSAGVGPDPARITDLDVDGAREVTFYTESITTREIKVYECTGPDTYNLVCRKSHWLFKNFIQTPDLDRDGIPELLVADGVSVYIYEAVADDSMVVKDSFSLPSRTYSFHYAVGAAPDMDRDGKNEAIVFGIDWDDNGILGVVESPCNDSFELVWVTSFYPAHPFYGNSIGVGDVDGDSIPEFAVTDGYGVRLFRCTDKDRYEQFWQTEGIGYRYWGEMTLYDINTDGKAELIYRHQDSTQWTIIREYVSLGVSERQPAELQRVSIYPLFVAKGAVVRLSGLPPGTKIVILDASGRVIASPEENLWHTTTATPGAYFVRIQLGNQSITHKVLVLK
ncbi:T9SS type A sorting domain-containing protein [candidate division WOR-3 bacterium]|nr:T9SS type A sorting domain-containing protein [candidate division WOR-3 bacterium]